MAVAAKWYNRKINSIFFRIRTRNRYQMTNKMDEIIPATNTGVSRVLSYCSQTRATRIMDDTEIKAKLITRNILDSHIIRNIMAIEIAEEGGYLIEGELLLLFVYLLHNQLQLQYSPNK